MLLKAPFGGSKGFFAHMTTVYLHHIWIHLCTGIGFFVLQNRPLGICGLFSRLHTNRFCAFVSMDQESSFGSPFISFD